MSSGFFRAFRAIYYKDLQVEWRTKDAISAMVVFGIMVITVFNFALDLARPEATRMAPGILWVAILFAGILGLNRSFGLERENESLHGIILAPVDPGAIYLGKMAANVTFLAAFELILLPIFIIMFNLDIGWKLPALFGVVLLGSIGFASVGTTLSAIAANTKMRDVLLPVLLFPLLFPVIIASVELTMLIMRGIDAGVGDWLRLLIACDIIFTVISILVFEYILVE